MKGRQNMKSMTGFGRAKLEKEAREYLVEIRSVNHKYADITVKAPRNLLCLEDKIRKAVLNRVSRGKIEVFVNYANYGLEGNQGQRQACCDVSLSNPILPCRFCPNCVHALRSCPSDD